MILFPFIKEPSYPTVNYPTIIAGCIGGDTLRLESLDGGELSLGPRELLLLVPNKTWGWTGNCFQFDNFAPFDVDGKTFAVSHQQKYSSWGWLKVNPDCYHKWWFWKLQQKDALGNWLPGTERGLYFRKPFSWRWDVAGTNGKHWIWTKGYLGGHSD